MLSVYTHPLLLPKDRTDDLQIVLLRLNCTHNKQGCGNWSIRRPVPTHAHTRQAQSAAWRRLFCAGLRPGQTNAPKQTFI